MLVPRWAAQIGVLTLGLGVLASELRPPGHEVHAQRDLVLDNVVLVTPGVGRERSRRVLIRHRRIVAIEPADQPDGRTRYVLPGLIDMHVHLPPRRAPGLVDLFSDLLLAHGVTSIREVGSLDGEVFEIARQVEQGERRGPRVFGCGAVLDGDPPALPVAGTVRSRTEGEAAVRNLASRGGRCVKVYEGISPEALAGIRDAAAELGLSMVGHVPSALPLAEVPLDDVQHLCYTRCGSASPEEIEAFVDASARRGIAHTPTLVVFEGQRLLARARTQAAAAPYNLMPRFWRTVLWRPIAEEAHVDAITSMQALVRRLHARRVRLHAGTDPIQAFVVPGASLHRELELLAGAGLSNEEALAAATSVAGGDLGLAGLGRIEIGAPADLIVLREDPTFDLTALGTIEAVIADGRLYPIETLRAALELERRYFARITVDLPYSALATIGVAIAERSLGRAPGEPEP